eukprot:SAG22_NODE_4770_length_1168_cov_1.708138_3_plen_48_part_01
MLSAHSIRASICLTHHFWFAGTGVAHSVRVTVLSVCTVAQWVAASAET